MKSVKIKIGQGYTVNIGNGLLNKAGEYFNLNRKVMIVTDSGVPEAYSDIICSQCTKAYKYTITEGENSKALATLEAITLEMQKFNFSRGDCIVAVGGGVVGDIASFCASVYERGVDFYNCPTTLLSMVDSSVGGKNAVNLGGVKNALGTFYQPKGVICDTDTLKTLPKRQLNCGFAEIIKIAAVLDKELFSYFENADSSELITNIEDIIYKAVDIKNKIVTLDEKESGIRRLLNFGHTVGHAIEQASDYQHGESIALGMLPMCSESAKARLISVLKKMSLPTEFDYSKFDLSYLISHDKKSENGKIRVILCPEIGHYSEKPLSIEEIEKIIKEM